MRPDALETDAPDRRGIQALSRFHLSLVPRHSSLPHRGTGDRLVHSLSGDGTWSLGQLPAFDPALADRVRRLVRLGEENYRSGRRDAARDQ